MTIELIYNKSEKNKVTKTLETLYTTTGTMREACDVINPTIRIQGNLSIVDFTRANYMYIPDLKRYYFITDVVTVNNELWDITGHVDVLSTYAAYIRARNALVNRSLNNKPYVLDDRVVLNSNNYIQTINFPNSFSGQPEYLLTVIGNAPGEVS